MGNSTSSSNVFLRIHESTQTPITTGSTISGEVRVPHNQTPPNMYGVRLLFIGKEDVKVCHGVSRNGRPKLSSKKKNIARVTIPLDTTSTNSLYPFQFTIPDQLPSSMHFRDGNGGYCCIRYKIKMSLPFERHGCNQEISLQIISGRSLPNSPVPSRIEPVTTRLRSSCMRSSKGTITMAAQVANTMAGVNDDLQVSLGLKNESSVEIEHISAKLKQTIEWRSTGRHSSTEKMLLHSTSFYVPTYMAEPRKRSLFKKRRSSLLHKVREEVTDTVKSGSNQVTLPIPDHAHHSYSGSLINISHRVTVKAITSSCSTKPKQRIPVQINAGRNRNATVLATQVGSVVPMPSAPPSFGEWEPCDSAESLIPGNLSVVVGEAVTSGTVGDNDVLVEAVPLPSSTTCSSIPLMESWVSSKCNEPEKVGA